MTKVQELPSILIVDDDPQIGATITRGLEKSYRVTTALDVDAARTILEQSPPDLLLLDVRLPGTDGLTFLAEVTSRYPTMPVIMLTAYASMEDVLEALRSRAYDFLEKPVRFEFLKATLTRALAYRRLLEERATYIALLEQRNTELVAMHQKLVAAENMALVGELVQGLMHEINNPLSVIHVNVELMSRSQGLDATQRKRLQAIESAARRVRRTMDTLTTIPFVGGEPQLVAVDELIERVVADLEQIGYLADCRLELDIPPSLPVLNLNAHQMEQVIKSILLNAAEATTRLKAGEHLIRITVTPLDNRLCLTVFNTGPTIPPDHLLRVFEPGYTTKRVEGRVQGLGLGLYIARSLIEVNGGQIDIRNESDEGVLVTLILPLHPERTDHV